MRVPKKNNTDFGAISRRSIKRDFQRVQTPNRKPKAPQIENPPEINATRRIIFVGERSGYFKFRSYIVGKLVRLVAKADIGYWCEFLHDDDRKALNLAAGWSDNKKQYLFDCVKFK